MRGWRECCVLVCAGLVLACGSGGVGTGSLGAVTGKVDIRACGGPPPASGSATCTVRPVAGAEVEVSAPGRSARKAKTDAGGRYEVWVQAGTYTVHLVTSQSQSVEQGDRTVKVEPGKRVEADFHIIFEAV